MRERERERRERERERERERGRGREPSVLRGKPLVDNAGYRAISSAVTDIRTRGCAKEGGGVGGQGREPFMHTGVSSLRAVPVSFSPPLLPQRVGALWVSRATGCPCRSQGAPSLLPREAPPRRDADATSIPPRVIARYEFHVARARKTTLRARNEGEDEDVFRVEAKKPEGIRLIRFYDPAAARASSRVSRSRRNVTCLSAGNRGGQRRGSRRPAIRRRFMGLETRKTMEKGEAGGQQIGPDRSASLDLVKRTRSARPRDETETENTSGDVDV